MISKSSLIKEITIKNYDIYEQCLYRNVLHNHNFYKLNAPLVFFFRWRYSAGNSQCILSEDNRHIC